MRFCGLAMILAVAVFLMSIVLRGQSKFVWSVGLVLIGFAIVLLAMTDYPAELAASIMGSGSIKVVPAPR